MNYRAHSLSSAVTSNCDTESISARFGRCWLVLSARRLAQRGNLAPTAHRQIGYPPLPPNAKDGSGLDDTFAKPSGNDAFCALRPTEIDIRGAVGDTSRRGLETRRAA